MKPKKSDIFLEAAAQVVKQTKSVTMELKEEIITEQNINLPSTKKTRKTFKDLKKAMDNEHAKRFNAILIELPDREFVRTYLKALEFFKPKVIRQLGGKENTKTQTINIQINRGEKS